jgi:hypothetical protein
MIEAILAVPGAIHAVRELLVGFDAGLPALESRENAIIDAEKNLKLVWQSLRDFSEASRELEAWKTVHHITNKLQNPDKEFSRD